MAKKPRYFIIVSHCLLNPSTRVHLLGRRYIVAEKICDFFLSKHISIIQLPCPEFTAMGYWRNPQGRQQYNNVFFRKHCKQELQNYVDMIVELKNNDNTPLCFIGIQGSPTCSIYWGKHKLNKYKTDKIYIGTITHKNTSRGFVGVPGKGGHYVTRYHTTIKFNNTSYQEDGYEIYTKYQIGDKIRIKEIYYPSHSIIIL